jgi:hypothetical protein
MFRWCKLRAGAIVSVDEGTRMIESDDHAGTNTRCTQAAVQRRLR